MQGMAARIASLKARIADIEKRPALGGTAADPVMTASAGALPALQRAIGAAADGGVAKQGRRGGDRNAHLPLVRSHRGAPSPSPASSAYIARQL